jgi:hypothetical protein
VALETAERVLEGARARALAAEVALAKHLGNVEVLRGDASSATLDPAGFIVHCQSLCCFGAPRLAAVTGRLYYEIELLQV